VQPKQHDDGDKIQNPSVVSITAIAANNSPPSSQTEMLDNVKYFQRFIQGTTFVFFANYEIDVDVRVNKITIRRSTYRSLDAH